MITFSGLDVFSCPLDGVNLIEASAGTGKTWAICGLYLRMLLEQGRTVDQILVVTFTNAATAELRDRIRARIVQALHHWQGEQPDEAGGDHFVRNLSHRLEVGLHLDRSEMIKRLELARETFDEAAIYTIHGFCQRALAETPFSAGLPFEVELVKDDGLLIQQAVNDFWRCQLASTASERPDVDRAGAGLAAMSFDLARYLVQAKDDPEKYARLLRKILGKPLSTRKWPDDLDDQGAPPDASAVQSAFEKAREIWLNEAEAIQALLLGSLNQLHGQTYKADGITQGKDLWNAWFTSSVALNEAYFSTDTKAQLYRQSKLLDRQKKGCTAPRHAFFDAAEALLQAGEAFAKALLVARLRLLRSLVDHVPEELRQKKRQQRVVAFDDMLFNLYQALVSDDFPWLAASLRRRYPAALIDEFQDTDPLQFDIFRTLYPSGETLEGTLFMVGDPKQAIYSFRNADLYTYLGAQKLATRHYTLAENQRSVPGLILGCNALFGANSKAFLLDGIDYRPVRKGQKPVPRLTDVGGEQRSPLQVWLLPRAEGGSWPTRAAALDSSGETVAAEIARLLRAGRAGRVAIDGRGLQAGDIAVLVRSHGQGRRMRHVLAEYGVGSVELSQASVFRSEEAEELERILLAVMEPGSERLVRAALATEILGCEAATLDAMNRQEAIFFDRIQRFADYRALWEQRSFTMMFRKLLREEGVEARLLSLDRGERRLTNVLHLGELLAGVAQEQISAEALLRWLGSRRLEPGADDAAQLRLESDRNLVQIVTIHKSKGLEYPIVFCPFLWDGYRPARSDTPDLLEYHEPGGQAVLDFRPDTKDDKAIQSLRRDETAAETLRLIYVATTRAVHRCYLIAGCYARLSFGNPSLTESTRSMLNWLVCGEGLDAEQWFKQKLDPEQIDAAWTALGASHQPDCAVDVLPDLTGEPVLEQESVPAVYFARQAPGPIPESWNRGSFSGMIRNLSRDGVVADHDTHEDVALPSQAEPGEEGPSGEDILVFPRGPAAGECIHHLFEHIDFTDTEGWAAAIDSALSVHPPGNVQAGADALKRQLRRLLEDVMATDLGAGFPLGVVKPEQRLNELAFTLPADELQADALNRFLREHGYAVGRLDFQTLNGYLSGAIDLVFCHGGRYYLLDWKSNHLGNSVVDYAPDRLDQAMTHHAYRLQYLLYSVALHRYLQRRLPDYDYERHWGGVYYLFVRGVRPFWSTDEGPAGVYFDRPAAATLMALDALIGGTVQGVSA